MSEAQSLETSGFEKARRELLDAGRNLWLASLGAVAEVEEGSRSWFDRMVERGRPIEDRQRRTFDEIGGRTATTVREMGQLFQDTVDYETRSVLKRLGVMTREDVTVLAARIDTLAKRIDELAALREIAAQNSQDPAAGAPATTPRRPRQRKQ